MYAIRVNKNTANQVQSKAHPVCSDSGLIGFLIGVVMKRIPLTQGQYAIVDNEDYKWLSRWKWRATWNDHTKSYYAVRTSRVNEKWMYPYDVSMAREILGLERGDKYVSDHINRITLDNQRQNLRKVTWQQNTFNRNNIKGYGWSKEKRKYRAYIVLNGDQKHLGYYGTEDEARKAYLDAKTIYHCFA